MTVLFFYPHSVITRLLCFSQQKATIFLHRIKRPVFILLTVSLCCDVRTGCLNAGLVGELAHPSHESWARTELLAGVWRRLSGRPTVMYTWVLKNEDWKV